MQGEPKMDGLRDIADLLSQYDWREFISIGIGTALGTIHAVYDRVKGSEREPSVPLTIFATALTGAYNPPPQGDSMFRNLGNGILGGLAYVISYEGVHEFANWLSHNRKTEIQE